MATWPPAACFWRPIGPQLIAGYAILQFTSPAEASEWTKRFAQVDAPGRLGAESLCELRPIIEL
jgi:hypothetical protein